MGLKLVLRSKITILLIIGFIVSSVSVNALRAKPSSLKNLALQNNINLQIFATNLEPADGYQLRLNLVGAKILNYQITNPDLLYIGVCNPSQATFTTKKICVDIVAPDGILSGDSLGTITIKLTSTNAFLITGNDNKYEIKNGNQKVCNVGTFCLANLSPFKAKNLNTTLKSFGVLGIYSTQDQIDQNDLMIGTNDVVEQKNMKQNLIMTIQNTPIYFWIISLLIIIATAFVVTKLQNKTAASTHKNQKNKAKPKK